MVHTDHCQDHELTDLPRCCCQCFPSNPYGTFRNTDKNFISFVGYFYVCFGYLCMTAEIEISRISSGENSFSLCLSHLEWWFLEVGLHLSF